MISKTILLNICFLISLNSYCQINNTWSTNYYIDISRADTFKRDYQDDEIWKIENEKIVIYHFEENPIAHTEEVTLKLNIDTFPLKIENSGFIFHYQNTMDTLGFSISNGRLYVTDRKRDQIIVFEKTPRYHLGKKKSKFKEYLYKNNFYLQDDEEGYMEIGFRPDHRILLSDEKRQGRVYPYFIIEEIENELFMIQYASELRVSQVTSFDKNGFNLLFYYGPEFEKVRMVKVKNKKNKEKAIDR